MRIRNVLIGVIAGAAILYLMYLMRNQLRLLGAIPILVVIVYVVFKVFNISLRIGESVVNIGDKYINDKIQSASGNQPPTPIQQIIRDSINKDFEELSSIHRQTEILKDKFANKYTANDANTDHKFVNTPGYRNGTISVADEIRKLKKLMDDGILTEDEFNAKKKHLLGI
jgi:hypothetical protein